MKTNYRKPQERVWYVKNDQITAPELRVLDDKGLQIGIMSRDEAITKAYTADKDLVMITNHAVPPVVKIIDFKKFLYQEEKKKKEAKKGIKKSSTKDIQLSVFIAQGDRDRLKRKAQEFINEGFQVRVKLMLRGREMGKKPMAFDLISNFIASLEDVNISTPPKLQGRIIFAVITRKK